MKEKRRRKKKETVKENVTEIEKGIEIVIVIEKKTVKETVIEEIEMNPKTANPPNPNLRLFPPQSLAVVPSLPKNRKRESSIFILRECVINKKQ